MNITDAVLAEHGVLYAQLEYVVRSAGERETAEQVRGEAAVLQAGLEGHALVEDEVLFPALASSLGADGGTLAIMRSEHEEIAETLTRALQAPDAEAGREALRRLVRLAVDHFGKEEQVLFPMAEELLDPATQASLGEEWAVRRLRGALLAGGEAF